MNFIFNLKKLRQKKGLTQKDLAEKMKIHQVVISEYELGKSYPSLENLVKLASILNVSLDELIIYDNTHD